MNKAPICAVAAMVLLQISTVGALDETGRSHTSLFYAAMDQIAATHRFTEVAISPDAKRVAWVEDRQEAARSVSPVSTIYVLDLDSPYRPARRVTGGEGKQQATNTTSPGRLIAAVWPSSRIA
jgi:hypothetical protein